MSSNKLVYTDKGIASVRENMFFTATDIIPTEEAAAHLGLNVEALGLSHKLPKMPIAMWRQIMSFHIWSVRTYRKETHLSHFITKDGTFITLPFHQDLEGMTIKINLTEERNVEIINQLVADHDIDIGAFHGTTHNHVTAGAFQSGTDSADEANTQGFHFTIGNLDKPEKSIHARVSAIFNGDPSLIVEGQPIPEAAKVRKTMITLTGTSILSLFDIPELDANFRTAPKEYSEWALKQYLTNLSEGEFPEEWKERVHEKKSHTLVSNRRETGVMGWGMEEEPLLDTRQQRQAGRHKQGKRSSNGRAQSHHTSKHRKGSVADTHELIFALKAQLTADMVEAYDDFKEINGLDDVGLKAFATHLVYSQVQCGAMLEYLIVRCGDDVMQSLLTSMFSESNTITQVMFHSIVANIINSLSDRDYKKLVLAFMASDPA